MTIAQGYQAKIVEVVETPSTSGVIDIGGPTTTPDIA